MQHLVDALTNHRRDLALLGVLLALIYAVSMIADFLIALYARPEPNYWPVIRLLAAAEAARKAQYFLLLAYAVVDPNILSDPVQDAINIVFPAAVAVWCVVLVRRVNRLPPSRTVDVLGHEHIKGHTEAVYMAEGFGRLLHHRRVSDEEAQAEKIRLQKELLAHKARRRRERRQP